MKGEQTKFASLMEALFSTVLGLVVAVAATQFICHMYDIPMTMQSNLILTFWMTVMSIVRSYVVRRMWNAEFWKTWKERELFHTHTPEAFTVGMLHKGHEITSVKQTSVTAVQGGGWIPCWIVYGRPVAGEAQ